MDPAIRQPPPRKRPGQGLGPRTINGVLLDVRSASAWLGLSEKALRAHVARRIVPFRRCGGRIYFTRLELEAWCGSLAGCPLDEARQNLETRYGEGHDGRS